VLSKRQIEFKKIKAGSPNRQKVADQKTVYGSEFQTDGAENQKARLQKSDLMNGCTSSGMADERKVQPQVMYAVVQLQTRSAIRRCG